MKGIYLGDVECKRFNKEDFFCTDYWKIQYYLKRKKEFSLRKVKTAGTRGDLVSVDVFVKGNGVLVETIPVR